MAEHEWSVDQGTWSIYDPHAPRRLDAGVVRVQREPDVYGCNGCHFQGTYAIVRDHVERRTCAHTAAPRSEEAGG